MIEIQDPLEKAFQDLLEKAKDLWPKRVDMAPRTMREEAMLSIMCELISQVAFAMTETDRRPYNRRVWVCESCNQLNHHTGRVCSACGKTKMAGADTQTKTTQKGPLETEAATSAPATQPTGAGTPSPQESGADGAKTFSPPAPVEPDRGRDPGPTEDKSQLICVVCGFGWAIETDYVGQPIHEGCKHSPMAELAILGVEQLTADLQHDVTKTSEVAEEILDTESAIFLTRAGGLPEAQSLARIALAVNERREWLRQKNAIRPINKESMLYAISRGEGPEK
jgi:hypothetical protein